MFAAVMQGFFVWKQEASDFDMFNLRSGIVLYKAFHCIFLVYMFLPT